MSELERLIPPVASIARQAATAILEVYSGSFAVRSKGDDSPVTAADMAAHHCIVDGLAKLTPHWPVLSEEAANIPWSERRRWQRYWLVDPLDGTREFVKRNGEFTVNIALIDGSESVLGVVLVPVSGHLYSACQGAGARVERKPGGVPEAIQTCAPQAPLRIAGSRSHARPEQTEMLAKLGETEIIGLGSSLKFCLIAEGGADLYLRLGPTSEWDTAAAHCVLAEAGGAVLDLDGQSLRYNQKESLLNPSFVAVGDTSRDWAGRLRYKESQAGSSSVAN